MSDAIDPQESYPIRLAKLQRELAAMQAQRDRLADAIRSFATDFEAIPWGFDGDCGAQRLLDHLYESLAAVEGGQP